MGAGVRLVGCGLEVSGPTTSGRLSDVLMFISFCVWAVSFLWSRLPGRGGL